MVVIKDGLRIPHITSLVICLFLAACADSTFEKQPLAADSVSGPSGQNGLNGKDGIGCYSSPTYAPGSGQSLVLPAGCENFGKKSVTGFVDFEKMDLSTFDMDETGKFFKTLKYIWLEADENGSTIIIKAKSGQANILKESLDFFIKEFEGEISGMGI